MKTKKVPDWVFIVTLNNIPVACFHTAKGANESIPMIRSRNPANENAKITVTMVPRFPA